MKNQKINRPVQLRLCQQGFTLLEVLVAVMILALSVTAILYQFSMGMEAGGKARDNTEAVLHAKEKIEELKAFVQDAEEVQSGTFEDGYAWETRAAYYELPEKEAGENENMLNFELMKLTVTIRWTAGNQERQYELSTLKAVKKQARQ